MRATPILSTLLLLTAGTLPAAADLRIIAFGDSVTEGYGDTTPLHDGYPGRLQRWLRQRGYDATVLNQGQGGETTGEALSRVDQAIALGGDYFIVMEGTNDISQRIGIETIRAHLNEMAGRAEAEGMVAIHASVIPRIPEAPVDADNAKTSALAATLRDLAELRGRPMADVFTLFESLPNLFENYYYYDPDILDVVGHPNGAGYTELAGLMLETMLALLETPQLEILPPAGPVTSGVVTTFGVAASAAFSHLEWDFGDGGWAASETPLDLEVEHVFHAAGEYTVTLRGETADGGFAEDHVVVGVTGAPVAWPFRVTLLPVAERGDGSEATDLVTDLRLQNFGARYIDVELALVPEISFDAAPAVRRVMVAPASSLTLADAIGTLFGFAEVRGALLVTARVEPGGSPSSLIPVTTLVLADDSGADDSVGEIDSSNWSAAQKVIGGIGGAASTAVDLVVANVDDAGGYVQVDLFDAQGAAVDSALFELGPAEIRFRSLTDLFRHLELRPQPFTAILRASGVRFVAAAIAVDPVADQIVYLHASP